MASTPTTSSSPINTLRPLLQLLPRHTQRWVSWHIDPEPWRSRTPAAAFNPDPRLLPGMKKVVHEDYNSSGFDRGHMCPTPIATSPPQPVPYHLRDDQHHPAVPEVNQRASWESLEAYCRTLVKQGKNSTSSPVPPVSAAAKKQGRAGSLANQVTVPKYCWKVVMVLDNAPGDDAARARRASRHLYHRCQSARRRRLLATLLRFLLAKLKNSPATTSLTRFPRKSALRWKPHRQRLLPRKPQRRPRQVLQNHPR
ncbi:MAG: DNA/RNA non-specific endonuclease [Planctomycetales bacterium]